MPAPYDPGPLPEPIEPLRMTNAEYGPVQEFLAMTGYDDCRVLVEILDVLREIDDKLLKLLARKGPP